MWKNPRKRIKNPDDDRSDGVLKTGSKDYLCLELKMIEQHVVLWKCKNEINTLFYLDGFGDSMDRCNYEWSHKK